MSVPARLLVVLAGASLLAGCQPAKKNKNDADSGPPAPVPLAITGMGTDVEISPGTSDSQAEPSALVLDDGTLLAAWMDLSGYNLYVKWTRSTDGGATWSTPQPFDEASYAYQNDPVFLQTGNYVYFTYLLVENANATKSAVVCLDSTDGGLTWSDPVHITAEGDFVDRQWMAGDGAGRAIMSWDRFNGNLMYQDYSESTTGCAGFTDISTVASGSFLNGVPVIDADGNGWASRANYNMRSGTMDVTLATDTSGSWVDSKVSSSLVTATEASSAVGENPTDEAEARDHGSEVYTSAGFARYPALSFAPKNPIYAGASGFDGFYSPVTALLPDGTIAVTTDVLENGSTTTGDTVYYDFDPKAGTTTAGLILNQDNAGAQQMEPWMAVDTAGGIHTTWFDDREGGWRLYGSTSVDGGKTWDEYTVADDTFKKGFDDYDTYHWVGHFQGLTANDTDVYAVWCDSRASGNSFCYVDHGVE